MATWNLEQTSCHLLICNGGSCKKRGAEDVTQAIRDEIARQEADRHIHTTRTLCNGRCTDACVVIAYPEGVWYRDITPERGREIVRNYLAGQRLDQHAVYTYDGRFVATGYGETGTEK